MFRLRIGSGSIAYAQDEGKFIVLEELIDVDESEGVSFEDFYGVRKAYDLYCLVPTYMPDGFVLEELRGVEKPFETTNVLAVYAEGIKKITFTILVFDTPEAAAQNVYVEKSTRQVSEFTYKDVEYATFENEEWPAIMWSYRNCVYSVYGEVTKEQIKEIAINMIELS